MMEDMFKRRDFLDFQNRIFHSIKKNLESTVEYSNQIIMQILIMSM
jgi:hypothetical protein